MADNPPSTNMEHTESHKEGQNGHLIDAFGKLVECEQSSIDEKEVNQLSAKPKGTNRASDLSESEDNHTRAFTPAAKGSDTSDIKAVTKEHEEAANEAQTTPPKLEGSSVGTL
jgi:hypothetical protein